LFGHIEAFYVPFSPLHAFVRAHRIVLCYLFPSS
jgi:hypothetical protein